MALITPIAQVVSAFDATVAQTITFVVEGGNQVVKNKITIRNNTSNAVVWEDTVESYQLQHTIPANTLTNGVNYNYYINTYDAQGNVSNNSNVISFWCLDAPSVAITNIPASGIIEYSNFNFIVQYVQSQGELLNEIRLYLYDSNHILLQSSEVLTSSYVPPLNLAYTFSNFENNKQYYLKVVGSTINNTEFESEEYHFKCQYEYNDVFFNIGLENDCNHGCVNITSNLIVIDGSTDGDISYIDNSSVNIDNGSAVIWDKGFGFQNNKFVAREWFQPILFGKIAQFELNASNRIELYFLRNIPKDEKTPKDYIEMRAYYGTTLYALRRSNFIDICNNNSHLFYFLKVNGNNFDIRLAKIETANISSIKWNEQSDAKWGSPIAIAWNGDTADVIASYNLIEWNGTSNVEYNKITDMYMNDDLIDPEIEDDEFSGDDSAMFTIGKVILYNSIVEHFNVVKNTDIAYDTEVPQWTNSTVMNASFNGNLNAGNSDYSFSEINEIKIKRRIDGESNWITIYTLKPSNIQQLSFSVKDYFIPSGKTFEYAIVPCTNGNERAYFLSKIKSDFNGVFVSDMDRSLKLYSGVVYSDDDMNQQIGLLYPYNQRYPTIIKNPTINYRSFTIQATIFDMDNETYRIGFDPEKVTQLKELWKEFLTDGKVKTVTDWNGEIIMGIVTIPPQFSYKSGAGMRYPTIQFTITEQGKYNNQSDLYRNGYVSESA